ARQLAAVGVRVEVNAMDKEPFYRLLERGESRFYLFGWAVEYVDAGEAVDTLFHSRRPGDDALGGNNYGGVADAALDALIEEADGIREPERRREVLKKALRRSVEIRAVLPLEIQEESFALSRALRWDAPINMAFSLQDVARAR